MSNNRKKYLEKFRASFPVDIPSTAAVSMVGAPPLENITTTSAAALNHPTNTLPVKEDMINTTQYIPKEALQAAEREALGMLMNQFTNQMFAKVVNKMENGYTGWDQLSPEIIATMKSKLSANIEKEDWADVANLAMFLWNFKQP